jgi:hypothetical protein
MPKIKQNQARPSFNKRRCVRGLGQDGKGGGSGRFTDHVKALGLGGVYKGRIQSGQG